MNKSVTSQSHILKQAEEKLLGVNEIMYYMPDVLTTLTCSLLKSPIKTLMFVLPYISLTEARGAAGLTVLMKKNINRY